MKLSRFRIYAVIGGIALILLATAAETGLGTYCNVCPVGFLQIAAASKSIPYGMIPAVLIGLILIYILGRFFCAWLCPTLLVDSKESAPKDSGKEKPAFLKYTPYAVLAAAVGVSFVVGFPIFCLICPIGVFFGFIFAVFKLFHVYEPSMNLIIFPAILIIEFVLFRKWCAYICPIHGVFRLVRKIPFMKYTLKTDTSTCLLSSGKTCRACHAHCPEGLTIAKKDEHSAEECTLCLQCKDACPTKSVKIK